jgi:hypothetical protein
MVMAISCWHAATFLLFIILKEYNQLDHLRIIRAPEVILAAVSERIVGVTGAVLRVLLIYSQSE